MEGILMRARCFSFSCVRSTPKKTLNPLAMYIEKPAANLLQTYVAMPFSLAAIGSGPATTKDGH